MSEHNLDKSVAAGDEGDQGRGMTTDPRSALEVNIDDTEVFWRAVNALRNDGVLTFGDALLRGEAGLMRVPGFGRIGLTALKAEMAEHGIDFDGFIRPKIVGNGLPIRGPALVPSKEKPHLRLERGEWCVYRVKGDRWPYARAKKFRTASFYAGQTV